MTFDFERTLRHVQTKQLDGSGGRRRQAHEHPNRGRLARAIGPQKAVKAAARYGERQAVDGGRGPEDLAQVTNRNGRRAHGNRYIENLRKIKMCCRAIVSRTFSSFKPSGSISAFTSATLIS